MRPDVATGKSEQCTCPRSTIHDKTDSLVLFRGSGLVSRKGCAAAPVMSAAKLQPWGRCAPLSRHKAAPT
ncbi:hypothetical protein F3J44_15490 [Pantoea sp. Tr-811]|nr:hypothetical protein [Pantoea sp. Tr-811]